MIAAGAHAAVPAQFDVAAVKPSGSNERMSLRVTPGGMFFATSVTLRFLVTLAWRVRDDQVTGGPSWLDDDRWDVEARSETDPTLHDFEPMLQQLLADRFKLVARQSTRQGSIYELVQTKNGSRLRPPADGDCTGETDPPCGEFRFIQRRILIGKSVTAPLLALTLSRIVERTVIDRTGIEGAWNVDLEWDPADTGGAALFTALEEQAGLHLQPGRGPVEVIVVDGAEKASEN